MNETGMLNNIWQELSANNLTQSDFDAWKSNFLQDQEVQGNVYNYLVENGLTQSSGEEWVKNINEELKTQQPTAESKSDDGSLMSAENLSQAERQKLSDKAFSIKKRRTASGDEIVGSMGAVYADNTVNIIKSLFTDEKERAEIVEGASNVVSNTASSLYNTFTKTIPAEISRAYKNVAFNDLYDEEELKYLKTLGPNAAYEWVIQLVLKQTLIE